MIHDDTCHCDYDGLCMLDDLSDAQDDFWMDLSEVYLDICCYTGCDVDYGVMYAINEQILPLDDAVKLMGLGYILDNHANAF